MDTNAKIIKEQAKLNRLTLTSAKQKLQERRKDTRQKIELGGLVIKAELQDLPKDIILGGLIDLMERLNTEPELETVLRSIGKNAFLGTQKSKENGS
jgi:hypothetical protein